VVNFADAQKLVKEGSNLYSAGPGTAAQPDIVSTVRQGFIEKSNVNSVAEMSRMIEVTRAYTQISAMLQQQGDLRKTALDKLADVPA
jgi:flagellar basal-body rod protein FlgF/flagellar basal-body rod protein FlgG